MKTTTAKATRTAPNVATADSGRGKIINGGFYMGNTLSISTAAVSTAICVADTATTGQAGVPAIVFTILNIAVLVATTAIDIYKKFKAAKREEDKKDREEEDSKKNGND